MNIAILGYGVVGGGVHALLKDGALGIHVKRILDIRPLPELEGLLTDNIADILSDPDIDCVVETIGGMHPALSFVTAALRAGKSVATSNKELISHALAPLAEGAAMHNVQIRFSASVGGGVPWIDNVARQKRSDTLLAVSGIVNGTTNYILDAMEHGASFEDALGEAQAKGYAEANPSADLDGIDVQRKCAISASLAFDTILEPMHIPTLGISAIRKGDIDTFAAHGLTCKLMMHASRVSGGISAYVEPTLLTADALAAHTPTNHNCISLVGEHAGHLAFFGQGAGRYPTAQNILQDLLDIAANTVYRARGIQPATIENQHVQHAYYVRTTQPGPLAAYKAEAWGDGILTRPMGVSDMHTLARDLLAADPDTFIAGIAP